ncbi:MAG: hypothetical protein IJH87_03465 [Atopobiaceae bacterium]|nr:hypothetical protein [Atopobiaceae bacterium]
MKKEIVVIGAGKIGRGSVARFYLNAGWNVGLFGHNPQKMADLAAQGYYETRSASGVMSRVEGFEVLDCSTDEVLVERLSTLNVAAIALYEGALPEVAGYIAKTVKARMAAGNTEPLNFMVCMNAPTAIEELDNRMAAMLSEEEMVFRREHIGLCFTLVLSGGTNPRPEDNPWLVGVSDSPMLEIDGDPWIGERVEGVEHVTYTTNGAAMIYLKVFAGNMSHAYQGFVASAHGMDFMDEGIADDAWAQNCAESARQESIFALTRAFTYHQEELDGYEAQMASMRQGPPSHDPVARVCNSPEKKVSRTNRFIWPALKCLEFGRLPFFLARGTAYGLLYIVNGHGAQPVEAPKDEAEVTALVERICGLTDEEFVLRDLTVSQYMDIPETGLLPKHE